jgi:hypothetical protein
VVDLSAPMVVVCRFRVSGMAVPLGGTGFRGVCSDLVVSSPLCRSLCAGFGYVSDEPLMVFDTPVWFAASLCGILMPISSI